jgi:uncharacterized membrane protein
MASQLIMISGLPARLIVFGKDLNEEEKENRIRRAKVFLRLHGFFGFIFVFCLAIFLETRWRGINTLGYVILFIGVIIAFFGYRLIFSGRIVVKKR